MAQGSWILFDFANSIFFVNIISVYFPLYFTRDLGGSAFALSLAFGGSQLLTGLTAIYWGAVADRRKRYRQLFVAFCLLTIFSAVLLSFSPKAIILIIFLLGFYFYATTGVFYESMLPGITDSKTLPRVVGLAGAAGMLGNLAALLIVAPFLSGWGVKSAFVVTAIGFLLFALPSLFWVRPDMSAAKLKLFDTLARPMRWLPRFLIARVLYGGALVTLIVNMPLMARQVFGLDDGQVRIFYIIVSLSAGAGAVLAGWAARRIKPLKLMIGGLTVWSVLGVASASLLPGVLYFTLPVIAFFAGSALSADRIFYIEAVSGSRLGEYLGLHRLAYLGGGVVVPIGFGATLGLLAANQVIAYRSALLGIAVLLVASVLLLRPLLKVSS